MTVISHINGRYALVDYNYRFIWLNVPNINSAKLIKEVMVSHLTLIIVDLTQLATDECVYQLIDNTVCLNWSVDFPNTVLRSHYELERRHGGKEILIDASTSQLINYSNRTMLADDRVCELQRCMMLLYNIYVHSSGLRTNPIYQHNDLDSYTNNHLTEIYSIFSKEIKYNQVVDKLYDYSNNNLDSHPYLLMIILMLINKHYD